MTDNEQRIAALEEEVKILKAQIQTTLLELQEFLLSNAFPSLRANHSAGSNHDEQGQPNVRHEPVHDSAPRAAMATVAGQEIAGVQRISIKPQPETAPPAPAAPSVNPTPVPATEPPPVPVQAMATVQPPAQPTATPATQRLAPEETLVRRPDGLTDDREPDWEKLEQWVMQKIASLGTSHTRDLIELYAEKGRFSATVRSTLLDVVNLHIARENAAVQNQSQPQSAATPIADIVASVPSSTQSLSYQRYPFMNVEQPPFVIDPLSYENDSPRIEPEFAANEDGFVTGDDVPDDEAELPEDNRNTILRLIAGISTFGSSRKPNQKAYHG